MVPACCWCSLFSFLFSNLLTFTLVVWNSVASWAWLHPSVSNIMLQLAMFSLWQKTKPVLNTVYTVYWNHMCTMLQVWFFSMTSLWKIMLWFLFTHKATLFTIKRCMSHMEWLPFHYTSVHEWNLLLIINCGLIKIIFEIYFGEFSIQLSIKLYTHTCFSDNWPLTSKKTWISQAILLVR